MKCFWTAASCWRAIAGAALLCIASSAPAVVVDFEDLSLAPETSWNGPDPTGNPKPDPFGGPLPVMEGSFASGGVRFGNSFNANYGSWGGFAYSNRTDVTTPGYTNQFSAFAGGGVGPGNDNYAVASGYVDNLNPTDPEALGRLPTLELPNGFSILGAYVTNDVYSALSMKFSDAFAKKFGGDGGNDSDWFKLTAYGLDSSDTPLGASASIYLADFRFADHSQDFISNAWQWFDLSPLAGASRIVFNLTSSDVGEFGMNTPGYFAIDNISIAAVPEASSLALLGGCGLLAGVASKVRRRVLSRA